jgi:hypothetical protein
MRDSKKGWPQIAEDNEMDADPGGNVSKNGCALHELAGMGKFLAQRAIRRVFVDGIPVPRRIRRFHSRRRGPADRLRHAGRPCRLRPGSSWRRVNVSLDDQNLDGKREDRSHKENQVM